MSDQKYGPQTAEIEAIIERLKKITPSQSEALRLAWVARTSVPDISWTTALALGRSAARNAAWADARTAAGTADWNAARNAILALAVRDLIATEQFDALYGPWASVMDQQ